MPLTCMDSDLAGGSTREPADADFDDLDLDDADLIAMLDQLNTIAVENVVNDDSTACNVTRQFVQNLSVEQLNALLMDGTEDPGARISYRLRRDIEMV